MNVEAFIAMSWHAAKWSEQRMETEYPLLGICFMFTVCGDNGVISWLTSSALLCNLNTPKLML